ADQLQLATLMLFTKDAKLIQAIMKRLPAEKSRALDVNIALIDFWMAQGNYDQAAKSIQSLQPVLETTLEGLLLLMRYNANAVSVKTALQYAKKVLNIDPYNLQALQLIDHYEGDIDLAKKRLAEDPSNPTLLIAYAQQLMQPAFEAYQTGGEFKD